MMNGKKVVVVMPAYNAAATLERTLAEVPRDIVDDVILVDDASRDNTIEHARSLGIKCFLHERNWGYGRNQKTCYTEALKLGADVAIMVHPDYQYTPLIIPAMANLATSGLYDVVLASRILGGTALKGGMPGYKYVANRLLTAAQNVELPLLLTKLSRKERAERVHTALSVVGLADRIKHRPREMSGGQQQRVAIARAIVSDPNLLLCDEPTGDLDRQSADEILSILQLLNSELGKTIVMVTHDPAAANYAKRVLHLDKGRFVERELAA